MKKTILVLMIAMLTFVSKAYAEVTYGISAALTSIDASGTETEGGEKNSSSADNTVVIPSLFAEYAYSDKLSVGLDFIPLSADVSDKTKQRTDTETSVTGTTTTTSTTRVQKAQAELENHLTLYANYMLGETLFFKAGVAYVEVSGPTLATGSKYGSEEFYGTVFGFGLKQDKMRFEVISTMYEDIELTSSVARAGVTTNNKIEADLDTVQLKLSYAF